MLFNQNNLKVSYSCMPNLGTIINSHNQEVMGVNAPLELGPCDCIVTNDCPLNRHCLTTNLLYEGTTTTHIMNYGIKTYKGITEPKFKLRCGNHKKAFNHHQYRKNMELSKEVWNVKDKNVTFNIKCCKAVSCL